MKRWGEGVCAVSQSRLHGDVSAGLLLEAAPWPTTVYCSHVRCGLEQEVAWGRIYHIPTQPYEICGRPSAALFPSFTRIIHVSMMMFVILQDLDLVANIE